MALRTLLAGLAAVCLAGCAMDTTSEDAATASEATPGEPAPAPEIERRPPPPKSEDDAYNPCQRYDRVIIQGYEVYYPIFCAEPPPYIGDPPPTTLPPSSELGARPEDGRIDGDNGGPRPCYGPDPC